MARGLESRAAGSCGASRAIPPAPKQARALVNAVGAALSAMAGRVVIEAGRGPVRVEGTLTGRRGRCCAARSSPHPPTAKPMVPGAGASQRPVSRRLHALPHTYASVGRAAPRVRTLRTGTFLGYTGWQGSGPVHGGGGHPSPPPRRRRRTVRSTHLGPVPANSRAAAPPAQLTHGGVRWATNTSGGPGPSASGAPDKGTTRTSVAQSPCPSPPRPRPRPATDNRYLYDAVCARLSGVATRGHVLDEGALSAAGPRARRDPRAEGDRSAPRRCRRIGGPARDRVRGRGEDRTERRAPRSFPLGPPA